MTSLEPTWRVRARPCPFYSQGQCLFADACNFLHQIKVKPNVELQYNSGVRKNPSPTTNFVNLPSVVIDSPRSTCSEGLSTHSSRSPRFSSLLLALQDVIGPEVEAGSPEDPSPDLSAEATLVSETGCEDLKGSTRLGGYEEPEIGIDGELSHDESCWSGDLDEEDAGTVNFSSCVVEEDEMEDEGEPTTRMVVESLRGDTDQSLPFPSLNSPASDHTNTALDSETRNSRRESLQDSALLDDDELSPSDSISSANDSGHASDEEEQEDDSSIIDFTSCVIDGNKMYASDEDEDEPTVRRAIPSSSTDMFESDQIPSFDALTLNDAFEVQSQTSNSDCGLLSPVEMSVHLRSSFSALKREDSIDSGYADSWTDPIPLVKSPPRSTRSSIASNFRHSFVSPPPRRTSYDVRVHRQTPDRPPSTVPRIDEHVSTSACPDYEDLDPGNYSGPRGDSSNSASESLSLEDMRTSMKEGWVGSPTDKVVISEQSANSPARSPLGSRDDIYLGAETARPAQAPLSAEDVVAVAANQSPTHEGARSSIAVLNSAGDNSPADYGLETVDSETAGYDVDDEDEADPIATSSPVSEECQLSLGLYDIEVSCSRNDDTAKYSNASSAVESTLQSSAVKAILEEFPMPPPTLIHRPASTTPPFPPKHSPNTTLSNTVSQKDTVQSLYDCYSNPEDHNRPSDYGVPFPSVLQEVVSPGPASTALKSPMSANVASSMDRKRISCSPPEAYSRPIVSEPSPSSSFFRDSCGNESSPQHSVSTRNHSPRRPRVFTPPGGGYNSEVASCTSRSVNSQEQFSPSQVLHVDNARVFNDKTPVPMRRRDTSLSEHSGEDSRKIPFGFRRPSDAISARANSPLATGFYRQPSSQASSVSERLGVRTDLPPELQSNPPSSSTPSTGLLSPVDLASDRHNPRLKPLRLSSIYSSSSSSISSSSSNSLSDHMSYSYTPHSPSVSSDYSLSHNPLLSSARSSPIPQHVHNILVPANKTSPLQLASDHTHSSFLPKRDSQPLTAPLTRPSSWRFSHYRPRSRISTSAERFYRHSSRLSTLTLDILEDPNEDAEDRKQEDYYRSSSALGPPSLVVSPVVHAIATPKPTLMFAIASDDVNQVRRVLESGEAGPNDYVGPQSALAFTLTNDKLVNKVGIVKALLSYGANPAVLKNPDLNPPQHSTNDAPVDTPLATTLEGMDPATRYYISRADAAHTRQASQLIHRSTFRPLTKVRYDLIGQDRALEQLFRILNMQSQRLSVAPVVVLLCGPSGHGKSLLARKFGSLLDLPTHTVNMTTLRSTHDLWQSYSMSPYEEPSSSTLAQFLMDNEGKRCVVVLDEIEKTEDEKALWSLLMPWELGRCSVEVGKRHVDVQNVIWLGTSNIGHDVVFEHHESRKDPDSLLSREEYLELIALMRPRVSQRLGASLLSRVTTVLPFVPFSLEEKRAIAAEAIYALGGDLMRTLSSHHIDTMIMKALPDYLAAEGARSLYRAISSQLAEM